LINSVWKLRSVLISAPAVIILTALMAIISLIWSLWDRGGRAQHRMAQTWSRMLLAVCFVDATIRGAEELDPNISYVVVANHTSYMDIRGDARASLKSMSEGAKLIRERGISVLLFPEGGRTETGIRQFKEGAAYIAIKAGVPIVPVGLVNLRGVLPMHSLLLRPARIEINVGEPIPTAGMTLHDRGRLNEILQERVAELAGESMVAANA
jgi:1-acyl-sn-glycerol-3-phosphate acyltransferase